MAQPYNPPHRVVTITIPFKTIVVRADPRFEIEKRNEVEYEFSNRVFKANRALRGAYNNNQN